LPGAGERLASDSRSARSLATVVEINFSGGRARLCIVNPLFPCACSIASPR
jgi:hypothetical protein